MRGSSFVDLPLQVKNKHACVNVKNDDDACFAWAVVSALHPTQSHNDRVTKYPHYSTVLKLDGITFPICREQVPKFEKNNDISVNIYMLKKNKNAKIDKRSSKTCENFYSVVPTRLTSNKRDQHVNLLLVQDRYDEDDNEDIINDDSHIKYHYVWIKNLSRLVSSQVSNHNGRVFTCERCLHFFYSNVRLEKHTVYCKMVNDYKVILPAKDGKQIEFKNFQNTERMPFSIFADFECTLKKVSEINGQTEKYQQHEAHSVGYYFKCAHDDSLSYYKSYRGPHCPEWFANELKNIAEDVDKIHENVIPMDELTTKQKDDFKKASRCWICQKLFIPKGDSKKKVRDHCHLTGRYRGPAHNDCNLNFKNSRTINVVFHNLTNYDGHLIIKDLCNAVPGDIKIIPTSTEKYIAITKKIAGTKATFKFIDSFRFMASSLDKLASYLPEKKIVRKQFAELCGKKYELLTRKGVFPYDYVDSLEKLNETSLPDIKQFHSSLTESDISAKDFRHAQRVWSEFNIKNLGKFIKLQSIFIYYYYFYLFFKSHI